MRLVLIAAAFISTTSIAWAQDQCPAMPTFRLTLDGSLFPKRPSAPLTGTVLEAYNQDVENYRKTVVEPFNVDLNSSSAELSYYDVQVRGDEGTQCSSDEVTKIEDDIATQQRIMWTQTYSKYKAEMSKVKSEEGWYKTQIDKLNQCRDAGGCADGLSS